MLLPEFGTADQRYHVRHELVRVPFTDGHDVALKPQEPVASVLPRFVIANCKERDLVLPSVDRYSPPDFGISGGVP